MFGRSKTPKTSTGAPARSVRLVRDRSGSSAVDLTKVRAAGHVDLAKRAEKTGIALSRRDLGGMRAEVVALLDYSGSMHGAYVDGTVQTITERALALGLQMDVDGEVPVILFGTDARIAATATTTNHQGIVDRELRNDRMGSTNLAAGLSLVLDIAKATDTPLYAFVVTDGSPDSRPQAEAALRELSHYPVFVKILATTTVAQEWLEHLDDALDGVLVDNIDAKFVTDPAALSDLEFADVMADELDTWVAAAQAAGLLLP